MSNTPTDSELEMINSGARFLQDAPDSVINSLANDPSMSVLAKASVFTELHRRSGILKEKSLPNADSSCN